jgi:hypothetical protein
VYCDLAFQPGFIEQKDQIGMRIHVFEPFVGAHPGIHPVSNSDGAPCSLNLLQFAENFAPFVNIQSMPTSQYWEKWTEVDLGVTPWTHRPLGTMVPNLAYIADASGKPMDLWIEDIPFRETRGYVKNVMAFAQVYGQLLGEPAPMLRVNEASVP